MFGSLEQKWKGGKLIGKTQYHSKGVWKQYVQNMKENKGCPAKGAIIVTISKIIELK